MPITIQQSPNKMWRGDLLTKLIQYTKNLLTPLEKYPGVKCGFVLDSHGAVIGSFVDSSIDQSKLAEIGRLLAQTVGLFQVHKSKPKELECRFQTGNLYVRDLGNALVAILFAPNLQFSLLRMELNVAAAPLERDNDIQTTLNKAAPSGADLLTPDYFGADAARWLDQIRQTS